MKKFRKFIQERTKKVALVVFPLPYYCSFQFSKFGFSLRVLKMESDIEDTQMSEEQVVRAVIDNQLDNLVLIGYCNRIQLIVLLRYILTHYRSWYRNTNRII
jgi:hypothetical protein